MHCKESIHTSSMYKYTKTTLTKKESANFLLRGSSSSSNNLDQLSSNDSLSGTVVKNLELSNHLSGVLGGVVHGVTTSGNLASVSLGKSLFLVLDNRVFHFKE
jgi:hypothetical protein